jgi:hypothetical protein
VTIQIHALDVSKSIVTVGKQLFGCFVSWLPGLFLKSGMSQVYISTSPQLKNQLTLPIQPMDPLYDNSKSCIGFIKINYDLWQTIVWVFCQLVAQIIFEK